MTTEKIIADMCKKNNWCYQEKYKIFYLMSYSSEVSSTLDVTKFKMHLDERNGKLYTDHPNKDLINSEFNKSLTKIYKETFGEDLFN